MGIALSSINAEDAKNFSRVVRNKDFEYIRKYLSDNLDRLRIESDKVLGRDIDLLSKGARQVLSELIKKTDEEHLKRIYDKSV